MVSSVRGYLRDRALRPGDQCQTVVDLSQQRPESRCSVLGREARAGRTSARACMRRRADAHEKGPVVLHRSTPCHRSERAADRSRSLNRWTRAHVLGNQRAAPELLRLAGQGCRTTRCSAQASTGLSGNGLAAHDSRIAARQPAHNGLRSPAGAPPKPLRIPLTRNTSRTPPPKYPARARTAPRNPPHRSAASRDDDGPRHAADHGARDPGDGHEERHSTRRKRGVHNRTSGVHAARAHSSL